MVSWDNIELVYKHPSPNAKGWTIRYLMGEGLHIKFPPKYRASTFDCKKNLSKTTNNYRKGKRILECCYNKCHYVYDCINKRGYSMAVSVKRISRFKLNTIISNTLEAELCIILIQLPPTVLYST